MNARTLLVVARGALASNGLRLTLTLACIALGVALAGAVHTVHTSALAEIDRAARALAGKADAEVRGPRNGFDDAIFASIAARPEVAVASPVVEVDAPLAGRQDVLHILGIDALRAVRLQPGFVLQSTATAAPQASSLVDPDALWLTPRAAARLGVKAGDDIHVIAGTAAIRLHVAGVLEGLGLAGEVGVMDIAAAQWRFQRVGSLSRIDLRLRPGIDVVHFRWLAASLLPAGVTIVESASLSGRAAAVTRAYRVNLDALSLVALATGAFLVFSTLALQAARRRQEFALLRALGVTRGGLAALLVFEAAAIGAVGAALGTALGLAASRTLLDHLGTDLGGGFFTGSSAVFAPDPLALAGIAALFATVRSTCPCRAVRAPGPHSCSRPRESRRSSHRPWRACPWAAMSPSPCGSPLRPRASRPCAASSSRDGRRVPPPSPGSPSRKCATSPAISRRACRALW